MAKELEDEKHQNELLSTTIGNLYEDIAELKNDVVHYRQEHLEQTTRMA